MIDSPPKGRNSAAKTLHKGVKVLNELLIRRWRVVQVEKGVMVFVDPRVETVRLFEGMDPQMNKGGFDLGPGTVERDVQVDIYEQIEKAVQEEDDRQRETRQQALERELEWERKKSSS